MSPVTRPDGAENLFATPVGAGKGVGNDEDNGGQQAAAAGLAAGGSSGKGAWTTPAAQAARRSQLVLRALNN